MTNEIVEDKMLTGVEARREAISKLYQAYKLLSDVFELSEGNFIYSDPDKRESFFPMLERIGRHIASIGMIDHLYFFTSFEGSSPLFDTELVEKYLMSEQENSIKPTGTEQPVETDTNKSSTHGNVTKTQFRTVSELDNVEEKLKRMGK
jgi:hypothetical protein